MSVEMFAYFSAYKLGRDVEDVQPDKGDGNVVLELLLSWGRRFSGYSPERDAYREIPYVAGFEAQADKWMEDAAFASSDDDEPPLSPQVGRLILERLLQASTVISANTGVGELLPHPSPDLSQRDQETAVALYWMHGMKLSFPVKEVFPAKPKPDPIGEKGPSSGGLLASFLRGLKKGIGGK